MGDGMSTLVGAGVSVFDEEEPDDCDDDDGG
jgi:hypothetical protein